MGYLTVAASLAELVSMQADIIRVKLNEMLNVAWGAYGRWAVSLDLPSCANTVEEFP